MAGFGFSATAVKEKFNVVKMKPTGHSSSINAFRLEVSSSKKSPDTPETEHIVSFSVNVVHLLLFAAFFGNNKSFGADHIYSISTQMVQYVAGLRFSRHMMYPYGDSFPLRDLTVQTKDTSQQNIIYRSKTLSIVLRTC